MDSGLGSDDEKRGRTKAQKQLQNEQKQLFSGCFIDATSLSDEGDFELRRNDERRQGALIFRSSIPQYSMLQMPSLDSGATSEELCNDAHEENVDETETSTPHNSIVQIESETAKKTPVGFYVDLGDVEVVETSPAAPVEKKNIFSMTIDFNVPKREMPSRLSTSLYSKKRSGIKTPLSLSSSRLSDRPSSSSSNNDEYPLNVEASVDICANPECKQTVKREGLHEKETQKEESETEVQKEIIDNNKDPSENTSRPAQQYVKLSDLEEQSPRTDLFFAPRMSRSIPEKSWVESPLATFRSASYRSSPQPFHLESSDVAETNSLTDSNTLPPKRSVHRLGTDLLRMFLEEIGPDVTVEVNGRKLRAHKCILSSRCQYFAAVLGGKPSEDVVSIQGYSYAAVHFAMCHIYSGAAHIPQSISVIELASLADMLGLEGLKEVVTHALKIRHCHNFHKPCTGCIAGVFEVLPLSVTYGLDDLYQASLKWISQYFTEVWPTRAFANLPRELRDKCYQQHVIYMTPETVLETIVNCDTLLAAMPTAKWAEHVAQLTLQLADNSQIYLRQHFSAVLNSSNFLALNDQFNTQLVQLEETLLSAAELLKLDQACHSYINCNKLLQKSWNVYFQNFLRKVCAQVENCIVRQIDQASRSAVWMQLEPSLRRRIRDLSTANLRKMKASNTIHQSKMKLDSSNFLSSSSDSSRNSSPAVKNTNRLQLHSPSLRRSLLIAARTPYTPPSPSTYRRTSTLTNPTQSSAAKSTNKSIPNQKLLASKPNPVKDIPKRPSTASVLTQKPQAKKSPTSKELSKKAPAPSIIPKRTVKSTNSQTTQRQITSPKQSGSSEQKKKVTNVDKAHKRSPPVQRSGTFLKEEPTVLHKIN